MTFSLSLSTVKLSNGKYPKLNIGRKSIVSSINQALIQVYTLINKWAKKLRQETVLNKSHGIKALKVIGKYSKQETVHIIQ